MPPLDRRRLLIWLGAPLLAAVGYPIVRYLFPRGASGAAAAVEFPLHELAPGESKRFLLGGRPAILVRTPEGLRAFWASCPHLGCLVSWRRGRNDFFCPCHGGRFDDDGRVLGGPPRQPLTPLVVEEDGETIRVRPT